MTPTPPAPLLECRAFGELTVLAGRAPVVLGGPKQRLLLAVLMCHANSPVRTDELIEALWSGRPPRTARKNLQAYVSRLRKVFGERLEHSPGGYRLRLDAATSDLLRFEQLARAGRQSAREGSTGSGTGTGTAVELLDRALGVWQGPPLAEFAGTPAVSDTADRLQELYLSALEDWAELAIEAGRPAPVLARLEDHVHAYVLRERLAAAWMRALALAGRPSEALAHFGFVRQALARELGVPPGSTLSRLHTRLLRGEPVGPPPGPAFRPVGNQLPRDIPDFVGRAAEVHRLVAQVGGADHGVVVVSGPVGSGKSALAVHSAHVLADRFPDGGLVVELGARPLDEVLADLLGVVGLTASAARGAYSTARALAQWRAWVSARRLLVILDDAAGEDVIRALLPGTGASGVIVTSRSRLSGVEGVLRVDLPPLDEAEGVELLGRIIGVGRVMADPESARRLVGCCEGAPLAVRIAGAKLNVLRHVRLHDYADRMCRAPRLLDEMAVGDLALRDRYETFHRGLTPRQREAYRRLVTLSPPFEHGQVIAALADSPHTAQLALESLVECNLLDVPDGEVSAHCTAYRMSSFAYRFGRERTTAAAGPPP
ncbi:DNA-binding transcriptional activator of the SARP family [Actinacidiphila yanglinensis]|uniref:DNA-binding transcriptional activator of the SARP family n=1 Tax=Actinacidiphila yanglinensis TaxID=310779 RepID=A0A1H6B250_9ACTN|nr:BTAD domain-containing putative transcriptional regulator [Actinacidiphila yanglinensis]SEG54186.1 DNA-binding transcriptional activator of the SARP family [Actinacidiphila yanglinensis]